MSDSYLQESLERKVLFLNQQEKFLDEDSLGLPAILKAHGFL